MDREYYYREQAKAQQAAVSKELATRQLLQEAGLHPPQPRRELRSVLRAAPVAILMGLVKLLHWVG